MRALELRRTALQCLATPAFGSSVDTCAVFVAFLRWGGLTLKYFVGTHVGRIWVKAEDAPTTILVTNSILNSEFISAKQSELMVKTLLTRTGKLPAA